VTSAPATHEFSADDDRVFLGLAASATRVGAAGYLLALLLSAAGVVGLLRPPFHLPARAAPVVAIVCLLGALPPALTARHLRGAAASLRAVATTAGHDVAHLMSAVDAMQRAFAALVVMLAVDVLGVAVVVAAMFPAGA
jgi:uncharacterized membrane protein